MTPCNNTPTFSREKENLDSLTSIMKECGYFLSDIITILTIHPKLQPIPKESAYYLINRNQTVVGLAYSSFSGRTDSALL